MKRILLALMMAGFLLPLASRAQAEAEVSLDFFYDNLYDQGNWIEVGDYGYCFQPNVAVGNPDWRPYSDGYWAYTDAGWTWVSYEDFGWATYHYGRWANLDDYGWVWVPGYDWGPAWVSWRTGGDYVGWAPLPPQPGGVVYEGQPITGGVDFTFGIGPLYYNFVDIRYIGEPVLRHRIYAPSRNLTIINNTVNVTNITRNHSRVYNYGPDYNRLNQYSTRPIQRLKLERETAVGANFGQGGRRGNFNRVNGNHLMVAAPQIERSKQPIAPKQVKARVDKPVVEHGWQGVANREQVEKEMKKASRKNVPPPNFQPQKGRKREAVVTDEPNGGDVGRGAQNSRPGQPKASAPGKVKRGQEAPPQNVRQNEQPGPDAAQQAQEQKALQVKKRQQEETRRAHEAQQQRTQEQKVRLDQKRHQKQVAQAQGQKVQQDKKRQKQQAQRIQETQQVRQPKPHQVHQPPPQPVQQSKPQQAHQAPPQNPNPNATPKGKKKRSGDEQPPP